MYVSQIIMLYTLNLHRALCQLYLNKSEKEKKQKIKQNKQNKTTLRIIFPGLTKGQAWFPGRFPRSKQLNLLYCLFTIHSLSFNQGLFNNEIVIFGLLQLV